MAPVNGMILKKNQTFVTLGKDQFTVKVKVEDEKHIYIIPDKYSSHDLRSIVMVIYLRHKVVPIKKMILQKLSLCDLGKRSIYGQGQNVRRKAHIHIIYIIPAKRSYPMSEFSCNGSKRYHRL